MLRSSLVVLVLAAGLGAILGCGEKASEHADAVESHGEAAVDHANAMSAELVAHLQKADAVDGKADHVVSQCAGCKLKMAGNPDHSMELADYQMHFCSAACKDRIAQGGEEAVLALEIPAATGHEGHNH